MLLSISILLEAYAFFQLSGYFYLSVNPDTPFSVWLKGQHVLIFLTEHDQIILNFSLGKLSRYCSFILRFFFSLLISPIVWLSIPLCIRNICTRLSLFISLARALCKEKNYKIAPFLSGIPLSLHPTTATRSICLFSKVLGFSWSVNEHFPHSKAKSIPKCKVGLRCQRQIWQAVLSASKTGREAPKPDSILGLGYPKAYGHSLHKSAYKPSGTWLSLSLTLW